MTGRDVGTASRDARTAWHWPNDSPSLSLARCMLVKAALPAACAGTTSLPAELNRILNSIKDLDERSDGE